MTQKHFDFDTVYLNKEPTCDPCSCQNKAEFICNRCKEPVCKACKSFHKSSKTNESYTNDKICLNINMTSTNASKNTGKGVKVDLTTDDCTDSDFCYSQFSQKELLPTLACDEKSRDLKTGNDHSDMIQIGVTQEDKISDSDIGVPTDIKSPNKQEVSADDCSCEPCRIQGKVESATHYCLDCEEFFCQICTKRHKSHQTSQCHEVFNICSLKEIKRLCDPCKFDGKEKHAEFICRECKNEQLCSDCKTFHKAQKQTRQHNVVSIPHHLVCEGCFDIGIENPAMGFCISCPDPELFCQSCSELHLSSRCTKNHKFSPDMLAFKIRSQKNRIKRKKTVPDHESQHLEEPTMKRPGKPYVTEKDPEPSNFLLHWQQVEINDNEVYQIKYKEGPGKWKTYKRNSSKSSIKIEDVKPQTTYVFRVRVIDESTGEDGPFSQDSDAITTRESAAAAIVKQSTKVWDKPIATYALPLKELKEARNVQAKTRKLCIGLDASFTSERNIMMVGATGSGKSTLINAFANYILGVTWEDPFRFTLINIESSELERAGQQAISQTEWITCYTIHPDVGRRLPYTITLIDTPGFGDTRGLQYDRNIVKQVRELFTAKGDQGVATIDAVCFILKAPDARLSPTQMYIFEAILSLFGNDIQENICSLITFADGERPPVLAGLEALEHKVLPYDKYFTFNNSALYANNRIPTSKTSTTFWEMGMESCKEFFEHFKSLPTKSLQLTSEVLTNREKLETTVFNLHQEVDQGLSTIGVLEQEIQIFSIYRQQIRENKDFTYTVIENFQEKIDISGKGQHTTNCLKCNYTCHDLCVYSNDQDKHKCVAMGSDGKCQQCPKDCHWTEHHNIPYIIKWVPRKVEKKYSEKQNLYQKASKKILTQEQVISKMYSDIEVLECAISLYLEQIAQYNNRLKEIALRPDPLSTVQYIDLLIDVEKREKKNGFESRIDTLEKCKQRAQYGKNVQILKDRVQMSRQAIEEEEAGDETSIPLLKRIKKKEKRYSLPNHRQLKSLMISSFHFYHEVAIHSVHRRTYILIGKVLLVPLKDLCDIKTSDNSELRSEPLRNLYIVSQSPLFIIVCTKSNKTER